MIKNSITERTRESLEKVFPEVVNSSLPTEEEINGLVSDLQRSASNAEDEIKQALIRFVASVAKQYFDNGLTSDELLTAGNLGLIKAGKRFNLTSDSKFISYAVHEIRQSILQAIEEKANI
jgi:RNA polymerase primary sigma factor